MAAWVVEPPLQLYIMAPRTNWQKRARLMVAARKHAFVDDERPSDDNDEKPVEEDDDDRHMLLNDDDVETVLSRLQWKEGAGSHLRKAHNGTGRSTAFARKALMKKQEQSMKGFRPLTSYFARQDKVEIDANTMNLQPENYHDDDETVDAEIGPGSLDIPSLDAAVNRLQVIAKMSNNSEDEKRHRHSKFDHIRFLCMLRFLESIRECPRTRVASSQAIAKTVYGPDKGGEYKARCIRFWGDEFVRSGLLMPLRQGKHQKSGSLLDDPDVKQVCLEYLRAQRAELIDGASFSQWVSSELHKIEDLGLLRPAVICERTARHWLHCLGFNHKEYQKGTYTDGHERPDVVQYRNR